MWLSTHTHAHTCIVLKWMTAWMNESRSWMNHVSAVTVAPYMNFQIPQEFPLIASHWDCNNQQGRDLASRGQQTITYISCELSRQVNNSTRCTDERDLYTGMGEILSNIQCRLYDRLQCNTYKFCLERLHSLSQRWEAGWESCCCDKKIQRWIFLDLRLISFGGIWRRSLNWECGCSLSFFGGDELWLLKEKDRSCPPLWSTGR